MQTTWGRHRHQVIKEAQEAQCAGECLNGLKKHGRTRTFRVDQRRENELGRGIQSPKENEVLTCSG